MSMKPYFLLPCVLVNKQLCLRYIISGSTSSIEQPLLRLFTLSASMCILINILRPNWKDPGLLKQSSTFLLLHFLILIDTITSVTFVCLFVFVFIASVSYTLARFRDEPS